MNVKHFQRAVFAALILFGTSGCKPSGPPPDIIKTQREDLQKAKAVDMVDQKAADEQKKAVDESTK